jgi:TRAP transporter TAXI family solute receptor
MTRRRTLLRLAALAPVGVVAAGCARDSAAGAPPRWHDGRLFIATGNTTGVFYQYGGGYADLVTKYVSGYEARAEPTGASGENCQRVGSGDMEIGLTFSDTAADAYLGKNAFDGKPQRIAAIARIYSNYTQVVVRVGANIKKFEDLRGKRVSTGSPNSGTDLVASRLLQAAGISPDNDITRLRVSLTETTKGMQAGTIDALFFSAGLPTPGVADLVASGPSLYSFLPIPDLLEPMVAKFGPAYGVAAIPKAVYNTPEDIQTVIVGNMIVVSPDMPDELARDLAKVLFDHKAELAKAHPSGADLDRAVGSKTDPVPLHPGARKYFDGE